VCCFAKFVFTEPYAYLQRLVIIISEMGGGGIRDWYVILVYDCTAVAPTSYTYIGYWFSS